MIFLVFPKQFEMYLFCINKEIYFDSLKKISKNAYFARILPSAIKEECGIDLYSCQQMHLKQNTRGYHMGNMYSCISQNEESMQQTSRQTNQQNLDKLKSSAITLFFGCVNESDVGFYSAFDAMINDIIKYDLQNNDVKNKITLEIISQCQFILCGTCGGCSSDEKQNIGDCYQIKTAYKYDRGIFTWNQKREYEIDPDKTLSSSPQTLIPIITQSAFTFSANALMNCDPKDFFGKDFFEKKGILPNEIILAEMETYDFFSICKSKDYKSMCLRVISDLHGREKKLSAFIELVTDQLKNLYEILNEPSFPVAELGKINSFDDLQKLCRKSVPMTNLCKAVIKIGNTEKIFDSTKYIGHIVPPETTKSFVDEMKVDIINKLHQLSFEFQNGKKRSFDQT